MKIKEITDALERFAPLPLQDGFDNAGLQTGLTDAEATGALLCLDVTEAVVDEAVRAGCNLIVAHHPLLFRPLKSLTGRSYVERCLLTAVRNGIAIYAAHTNLDNAPGGVNFKMAEKMGMSHVRILRPQEDSLLKLVTFVPVAEAETVRRALFEAGCGSIGHYDSCSYNVAGEGTFRAGEGTHPFCGRVGELHREAEIRVETVLPVFRKTAVVKALLAAHPYEEPAFDLYPLKNAWTQAGSGVVGELDRPETEEDFLRRVKRTFRAGCLKHTRLRGRTVRTVALCGGSGAFLLPDAVAAGADAFLTGEVRYHDYFCYEDDILVAEAGHYETEQFTTEIFRSILEETFPGLQVRTTQIDTNPIKYL